MATTTSNALTLYAIEENLLALLDTQEMVEDEQAKLAILNEIAEANEAAVAKRDNVIRFLRRLKWMIGTDKEKGTIDQEIEHLKLFKAHLIARRERIEEYILGIIEQFGASAKKDSPKRLCGSIGELKACKKAPSVQIEDETQIPSKYKRVTVTMDADDWLAIPDEYRCRAKKADYEPRRSDIKEALTANVEVPGADLSFAGMRLDVR